MRVALLSDVHGNAEALRAVLQDAEQRLADDFICLGDLVGYGADPDVCVDEVMSRCSVVVAGNHDLAAAGALDAGRFNSLARRAVEYTRERLGAERIEVLRQLPLERTHLGAHFVHASPVNPARFPYLRDPEDAAEVFRSWRESGPVFLGHTHVAVAFEELPGGTVATRFGSPLRFSKRSRVLCNVGSVGQPRDHDPRACYGILDTRDGSFARHRVAYDVDGAIARIHAARLPDALGQRLRVGV